MTKASMVDEFEKKVIFKITLKRCICMQNINVVFPLVQSSEGT